MTRNAMADWIATATGASGYTLDHYISFGDSNVTASDGSQLRLGMHVWEEKIGVNYRF